MKVYLVQTIPNLGKKGEIINVSNGYARNFLFPKRLATIATPDLLFGGENKKRRQVKKKRNEMNRKHRSAASLLGKTLILKAKASSEGRLFGGITPLHLVEALEKDFHVSCSVKDIESPIFHVIGYYEITLHLGKHPVRMKVDIQEEEEQPRAAAP